MSIENTLLSIEARLQRMELRLHALEAWMNQNPYEEDA